MESPEKFDVKGKMTTEGSPGLSTKLNLNS